MVEADVAHNFDPHSLQDTHKTTQHNKPNANHLPHSAIPCLNNSWRGGWGGQLRVASNETSREQQLSVHGKWDGGWGSDSRHKCPCDRWPGRRSSEAAPTTTGSAKKFLKKRQLWILPVTAVNSWTIPQCTIMAKIWASSVLVSKCDTK